MVEVIENSNCLCWSSNIGVFDTAGLALLHYTNSATENSSIDQRQPLLVV